MTKEQQVVQDMLDGNKYLIEQSINNAPYDKCMVGLITQVNDDNTYSVKISEEAYTNIPSLFTGLNKNDTVKVFSPQNQFSQLFILGKYNMELSGGGITSVNGYSGVVVLNASDVGALPSSTVIPTKTSGLTNDSNYVSDSDYIHTDNNFTSTLKNKLDGIQSGAEVNVNADWNITDTTNDGFIKNKPVSLPSSDVYVWAKQPNKPTYTANEVDLGNVPNVTTNNQTPTYSDTTTFVTLSSGETLSIAFSKIKLAITNLINHIANKSNPHAVTKTQVGLSNVDNVKQYSVSNPQPSVTGSSGSCTGNSATATKASQDASGNIITSSYGATLSINGQTVSLVSKSGETLSSVTVPTGVIEWQ